MQLFSEMQLLMYLHIFLNKIFLLNGWLMVFYSACDLYLVLSFVSCEADYCEYVMEYD